MADDELAQVQHSKPLSLLSLTIGRSEQLDLRSLSSKEGQAEEPRGQVKKN